MDYTENIVKRESRLAVFEHVVEKKNSKRKKFKTIRSDSEESSPSESELIIDEEVKRPKKKSKKKPSIKFNEEQLSLLCEWKDCNLTFDSWSKLNDHLINHTATAPDCTCKWSLCDLQITSQSLFNQHVAYHSYYTKLKQIGNNVLLRNKLPECKQRATCVIPILLEGYTCEWENCSIQFWTILDFFNHVASHVNCFSKLNKPTRKLCGWKGCGSKFSSKSKLGEHVRTHTKEKVVGCPTCCLLFSNNTKFCDHRRRQSLTDLQSFQCSQCLKLFPTEGLLREHIRSHINHYKCTMCDMTCSGSWVLAKHIRYKHVKETPFKCDECDKRFVDIHNLRTHVKTHQSDGFKCELCDFKCRSAVGLRTHCRNKHDQQRLTYECHCCKKKFLRGSYLTKHLMKVHKYHWPSGHSRFRYRKDQDGIYRLQTVRYESLEVTEEMIKSESRQSNVSNQDLRYRLRYDNEISVNQSSIVTKEKDVVITINDVDEHGNIVKSEVVNSTEIVIHDEPLPDIKDFNENISNSSTSSDEEPDVNVTQEHHNKEVKTEVDNSSEGREAS